MLYRPIVFVICEIHTERINALCGHSVEFFIVTTDGTETNR
jgi:hypothetical protein